MKRLKTLEISIPEPCGQDWSSMNPTAQGRFCNHCQKTVVDFTGMSDAAFLAYVAQNRLGCGKFRKDQIERSIVLPTQKANKWWMRFALAGSFFVTLIKSGDAQTLSAAPASEMAEPKYLTTMPGNLERDTITISGRVVDEKKERIVNAVVCINKLNIETRTDIDGNFTLKISKNNDLKWLFVSVTSVSNDDYMRAIYRWGDLVAMNKVELILQNKNPMDSQPEPYLIGRTTGTVYVVDGIALIGDGTFSIVDNPIKPPYKTFWQRLQFWKK